MPNPFYYGGHINPDQFVGRRAELQRIFAGLEVAHTGQMQSFSVVGPRRIGKSSLLFYLANEYARYLIQPDKYHFAYVDLQDATCRTLAGLLQQILEKLAPNLSRENSPTLAGFMDAIQDLRRFGISPVVCLDELEELAQTPDEFSNDMYDTWRHLVNTNAIAFITASKISMIDVARSYGPTSPFFNVFVHLQLGEFTDEETRELVYRGVECDRSFRPEEQKLMVLLAGNHPSKLQLAGTLIYESKAHGYDLDWVQRAFQQQISNVGLGNLNTQPDVTKILVTLLTSPRLLGRAFLEGFLRIRKSEVNEIFSLVIGWLLIVLISSVMILSIR